MSENTTYTRGTTTERRKTARLEPGDRVLTMPARVAVRGDDGHPIIDDVDGVRQYRMAPHPDPLVVRDAQAKTDAVIRTVDRMEYGYPTPRRHRAPGSYVVHFTDGTRAEGRAPILTWHALPRV